MKKKLLFSFLFIFLLIVSCDKKSAGESANVELASNPSDSISAAATVQDKNKKFIHTANVNLDVKDVFKSTLAIEKNVVDFGGYVSKSNLTSNIVSDNITPISKDSAREVKVYRMVNNMEVRIPQPYLRDFLLSMNKEIEFLNSRSIEANDVTISVKSLDLDKKRLENTQGKLDTVLRNGGKSGDKQNAINSLDNTQAEKDRASITKEILNDKIQLATVTISLQENPKVKQLLVANTQDYNLYSSFNFGYKAKSALLNGIDIFQFVLVGLLYLWPFWILLIAGIFLYRRFKKNRK